MNEKNDNKMIEDIKKALKMMVKYRNEFSIVIPKEMLEEPNHTDYPTKKTKLPKYFKQISKNKRQIKNGKLTKQQKLEIKISVLAKHSLNEKWLKKELYPLDPCSFCYDTRNKFFLFRNCKHCVCPKHICDLNGIHGLVADFTSDFLEWMHTIAANRNVRKYPKYLKDILYKIQGELLKLVIPEK